MVSDLVQWNLHKSCSRCNVFYAGVSLNIHSFIHALVVITGESRDFPVSEMDDFGSLDGLKVGSVSVGEIGPFTSIKLDIVWQPTVPGKVNADFLVSFTDPLSEGVSSVRGDNTMWL